MSKRVTFWQCVMIAAGNRELVENFDRLADTNLSLAGSPLDRMIDEATGKQADDIRAFLDFVWECIYTRLPPDARA